MNPEHSTEPPRCLPPNPPVGRPSHALPAGATDCHCHVFEDPQRWPMSSTRGYTPAAATTRQDYARMCRAAGIDRTVQVSASVYGFDNSLTLDVIREWGQERARGVAGVAPGAQGSAIAALHRGGMRGARLSTHVAGYGGTEAFESLADLIKPYGWHVQMHVSNIDELAALERRLLRTPVPLVFDHMGCVRGNQDVAGAGFQALLGLLAKRDDCWVKISSWQRRSLAGPPEYADMTPFVDALVKTRPDRLVFGTNWPNPSIFPPDAMPDDIEAIDRFCAWVPDEAVRHRILVTNPAALYGFS